jgi:hypothetical protein
MRRAASEAFFIARNRVAFGRRLIEMPLMRRQLMKILLPGEQARTMMFQTAAALERADAGDSGAHSLARVLTPLIKFRACRDARNVTGDAMEVRGGCGYIEEWPDPRLLRDAHLGSIWEGTSNIVALDVNRAIRRDHSLDALQEHWAGLLKEVKPDADLQALLNQVLPPTVRLAETAANGAEHLTRRAASALYHVTTAVAMAWEAARIGQPDRAHLARLVLTHRVLPIDPLSVDEDPRTAAVEEALLQR